MDPFYESGGFVHDMDDQQYARLMRALGFSTPDDPDPEPILEGSTEALTMDGPLPTNATVEPDHLLEVWADTRRLAASTVRALATDLLLAADLAINMDEVQSTVATELWACIQDTIGFCRLGVFEEWSE